jgi:RNA recognition motif-containing protein
MNIYISNLGDKATDGAVRAAFEAFGKVSSARVILDGFTGYPRGFAFVEMPNETEAASAIAKLNGSLMDGHTISVSQARPRKSRNTP